ncbi:MAG: hypothetical protein HYU66_17780, partial [Armatimonadetes bacterium]|nr:hypothetical protein [Armatimonadota bacterium]
MPAWKQLVGVFLPALCLAVGGVSLDARDMPLRDALDAVAQQSHRALEAADLPNSRVNLRLRDVSLDIALQTLCRDAGLQFEVTADEIVVRPAALAPASVHPPEHVPARLLAEANRLLGIVLRRP